MIEHKFLAINKDYLSIGLNGIEVLIVAQIEEYERNNCQCYLTNKQLASIFGESESTIKRIIRKLDTLNVISRNTFIIDKNGRANKQRTLSVNQMREWRIQFDPTKMDGSKMNDGRVKNELTAGQNDPIKDNIKDKEKDNILNFIRFDDEIVNDIHWGMTKPKECMSEQFYSFAFDELDRLGNDVVFVVSYDKIQSYKNGKRMGIYCNAS